MIEGQQTGEMNNNTIEQVLKRLADTAHAATVFGQPLERGEAVVVPCAEVMVGLGFGMGRGLGPAGGENNATTGGGSGAGAGGGARGRPIAAIVISQDGVRVEPILDVTRVTLASLTTSVFVLIWLVRLFRGAHGDKGPSFKQLRDAIEG